MKEKIKKIIIFINNRKIVFLIILIGVGLVYWFGIRPPRIYSYCNKRAIEKAQRLYKEKIEEQYYITDKEKKQIEKGYYLIPNYEAYYKRCLREKGINQ